MRFCGWNWCQCLPIRALCGYSVSSEGPCMHGVSLCNTEDVSISLKVHLLRSSRWTLRPVVAVLLKMPLVLFPLSPLTFVPLQWQWSGDGLHVASTLGLLPSSQALSIPLFIWGDRKAGEGCLVRGISLVGRGVIASWKTRHYCSFFPSY